MLKSFRFFVLNFPVPTTTHKKDSSSTYLSKQTNKKMNRAQYPFLLLLIPLYTFTLHSFFTTANENEKVGIQKLECAVGVYFDNIGTVQVVNSHWIIYVYYNMSTYWQELDELKNYVDRMEKFCTNEVLHQRHCMPTAEAIRHRLEVIEENNILLYSFNSENYQRSRLRRSPLDIVGNIAHGLFGVLDNEYAANIEAQILKIKNNENHFFRTFKKTNFNS